MQGTLELTPVYTGGSFPDGSFKLAWASAATNTGGAFDVRFRVNHGDWRVWKNDTSKFRGRFGKNGNPVTVKPGKDYGFKARSQKSSNPSKHSDWSPAYGD